MGTVITMYAAANPVDSMNSIDVPQDGSLLGVDWAVSVAASGADFAVNVQLSFGSTSALVTNDVRAPVSTRRMSADLTTSGAAMTSLNVFVPLPKIPVAAGERIYLHASGTAITTTISCALHFDFEAPKASIRRSSR